MPKHATLLFTDIEGSTRLWELDPEAMSKALHYHDLMIAQTVEAMGGTIFKTLGDGVCALFDSAPQAFQAAMNIQRLLYQVSLRQADPLLHLSVRIGIHTGMVEERANDYFGVTVNRVSRLMNAAHGGQVLLSAETKSELPTTISLRDLGTHRLRDISEPMLVFQATSSDFPLNTTPIRTQSPRPNNLPSQLTSFIGREQTVADICSQLRQSSIRLLTLVGTGGIGKTRLSMQVAAALLDEYEDGTYFVSLAPLHSRAAILKQIAQIFEIQEEDADRLSAAIQAHLQTRQMLLVFDNFEHVLDASPLVNELLGAAPRIKVLATSRESLFIYGEHTYAVPPLALPEPSQPLEQLSQSTAVTLIVKRIQAIQPDFILTDVTAPHVVSICRNLEGIPLALELAAARFRDLSLPAIVEGLTQRLALLNKGQRDLPARQQTMNGAIDWSYQLLSEEDQRVFARLSVFEGQFYEVAALSVTGAASLESLLNKNLLQRTTDGQVALLAVLREFANNRLTNFGEVDALRMKHGVYYCEWLEVAENHLNGREQIEWFGRLGIEQFNLQAALQWFLSQSQIDFAARMVAVLWRYWATQSQLSEGAGWIDKVIEHDDTLPPLLRARVLQGAGRLALLLTLYDRAIRFQIESVRLYAEIENAPGQAAVYLSLGETESMQGHDQQARDYFAISLKLSRELDDLAGIGRCLKNLGRITARSGDFASAEPLLRESLSLAQHHGSSEGIALAFYELAGVLRAQEKFKEAESAYQESVSLYRELNFPAGIAVMLYNVGFALGGQGKHAEALDAFQKALGILQPLEELSQMAECLVGAASVLLDLDRYALSAKTLSAANAIMTSSGQQLDQVDQVQYDRVFAVQEREPAVWQREWDGGRSVSLAQLVKEIAAVTPQFHSMPMSLI